jgi:paraquat-inducible protein B
VKRPSPGLIGAFVLGALALVVAAVLFFSAGSLREKRIEAVSFFDGSVAGLRVGAPVTFRGVPVGEVKSLGVRVNPRTGASIIQVNMALVPDMVTVYGAAPADYAALVPSLVRDGLTAQLVTQSFVTGMLSIELAFRPGARVSRIGDTALPEVPTVPGDLEALAKQLQAVDVAGLAQAAQRTLAAVDALVSSPELRQSMRELPETLRAARRTLAAVDALVSNPELGQAMQELPKTLRAASRTLDTLDREAAGSSAALQETLTAVRQTVQTADATLRDARTLVDPRGHTAVQVQRAVDDLAATSARLRNIAERVDRDPSVLVRGR